MHIGIVSNEYPPMPHGGIGSVYQDLAEMLVRAGHRVTVLGIQPRGLAMPGADEEGIAELRSGVRIRRLAPSHRHMRYHLGALTDRLRLRRLLLRLHREDPFDLIETADYGGLLSFGGIPGVPLVVRIHGSNVFFDKLLQRRGDAFEHLLERRNLRRATHLCAVSNFAAKETLALCGMSSHACRVIPNAVDVDLFTPETDPAHSPVSGRILFVNAINPKKGIEELICALPYIVNRVPDAHLVIVGRESLRGGEGGETYTNQLLEKVRPNLRGRVTFTGPLDRRVGVLQELREAQVCCYPSHMETFGIAPVEAMALGKPTVFSQAGPGPEIIEHGVDGLLCNPLDPKDIADKICAFLTNPDRARATGIRAREKVIREFCQDRWLKTNLDFYADCIKTLRVKSSPMDIIANMLAF